MNGHDTGRIQNIADSLGRELLGSGGADTGDVRINGKLRKSAILTLYLSKGVT
jgi:hypothetical protein